MGRASRRKRETCRPDRIAHVHRGLELQDEICECGQPLDRAVGVVLIAQDLPADMTRTRTLTSFRACDNEDCTQTWLLSGSHQFAMDYPGIEQVYAKPVMKVPRDKGIEMFGRIYVQADEELLAMGLDPL